MNPSSQTTAAVVVGALVVAAGSWQLFSNPRQPGPMLRKPREFRVLAHTICRGIAPCIVNGHPDPFVRAIYLVEEPPWTKDPYAVQYFIAGKNGRRLQLILATTGPDRSTLMLPRGYGTSPKQPRLEVVKDGVTLAGMAIPEIPDEERVLAKPTREDPRISLYWDRDEINQSRRTMKVRIARKLGPAEWCHITVRRTTYLQTFAPQTDLGGFVINQSGSPIWLPSAEVSDGAVLLIDTYRSKAMTEKVKLRGVNLAYAGNRPYFQVPKTIVGRSPSGFDVVIPKQPIAPVRPLRRPSLVADLGIRCVRKTATRKHADATDPITTSFTYRLVAPTASELGLALIRTGNGLDPSPERPSIPVRLGPVDVVVEIRYMNVTLIDSFEAVVPIPKPPSEKPPTTVRTYPRIIPPAGDN